MGHITIVRDLPAHRLNAPALKGFGVDPSPVADTTLGDYVDSVATTIDHLAANGLGEIVLVGHSVGGLVLNAVGERIPDRIAKLVYLCGHMPRAGVPLPTIYELLRTWERHCRRS